MSHNAFGYVPYDYYTVYLGSGQVLWYNISLTPNPMDAWINGTVSDASTGAPIAGATVIAQVDGTILPSAVANATGFYSLSVPTGSVELSANALGYGPTLTSTYVWSAGEYILNIGLTPLAHGVRGYVRDGVTGAGLSRSEEHTSELQSRLHLVCRLLLEKKKNRKQLPQRDASNEIQLQTQSQHARPPRRPRG